MNAMNDYRDIKFVLASQSPRRAELFKYISKEFEILPANCDETAPDGVEAGEVPQILAARKALAVSKERPDALVIGCDTVVIIEGKILGKPGTIENACEMLKTLSGRMHTVVSGVCLCYNKKTMSFTQKTDVMFYDLSESEIDDYANKSLPLDKAGAYGIQDGGALFVEWIRGNYYNVVGLPLARLKREIDRLIKLASKE